MKATIGEVVKMVGGDLLRGEPDKALTGFAALDVAGPDQISFFGNPKYASQLAETRAGAVFVSSTEVEAPRTVALILVDNPVVAFDVLVGKYGVKAPLFEPGISPAACIDPQTSLDPEQVAVLPNASISGNVSIGNGTRIGAGAVICAGARIGSHCEIGPNVTIREGCIIGDRVIMHPGVVIGADGFGFEFCDGRHQKIEQLGIVRIADDVEIGSNTTIDRARFGETLIGEGSKIDNLVQIGHNVVIGKHCIIVALTGIAGSVTLGDYVTVAAQSGFSGHLKVADRVTLGARVGVISSIEEPGGTWFGYPAKPFKESRRESMWIKKLPGILKRVKQLEEKVDKEG